MDEDVINGIFFIFEKALINKFDYNIEFVSTIDDNCGLMLSINTYPMLKSTYTIEFTNNRIVVTMREELERYSINTVRDIFDFKQFVTKINSLDNVLLRRNEINLDIMVLFKMFKEFTVHNIEFKFLGGAVPDNCYTRIIIKDLIKVDITDKGIDLLSTTAESEIFDVMKRTNLVDYKIERFLDREEFLGEINTCSTKLIELANTFRSY